MNNIKEWLYNYLKPHGLEEIDPLYCPCLRCTKAESSPSACACDKLSSWLESIGV